MTTTASRAFLDEIRAQRAMAFQELWRARAAQDEPAASMATGRLCDLEELAQRNDPRWLTLSRV